ncbi:serine hydrolase domain-containing protein [Rugosimonospora africana]|uniref:Esterase n=1 Tax=Rugosimonospora africana TaxID=556532 RepID=A0A8J3VSL1_9ACTN|nr:serine hydrolase domain-containing protein [Rugosimonospora africana]GIH16721.1 esterase [Rugosimonospora africana]
MSAGVQAILEQARDQRMFSAAAWSYGSGEQILGRGTIGTLSWGGPDADAHTLWDLASVTKPIVGLAVMSLVESGMLLLEDTIGQHLPAFAHSDKANLTIRQLLTHTSGIPGQIPLYRWCSTPAQLVDAIRDVPVAFAPGSNVTYSSQGFILLGLIAEAVSGQSLDQLVAHQVTRPAGMMETRFLLPADLQQHAAATEECPWRGRLVQGTVHDENAEVLGGIAGHAGLFASLADVESLGQVLCRGGVGPHGRLLSPAGLVQMIEPATDHLPLRRGLAWQGRDPENSPAGDLLGVRAYGHTGFTGTSLWIDPDLGIYIVLLTNRVHPSRAGEDFARVRRLVHNEAARDATTNR